MNPGLQIPNSGVVKTKFPKHTDNEKLFAKPGQAGNYSQGWDQGCIGGWDMILWGELIFFWEIKTI